MAEPQIDKAALRRQRAILALFLVLALLIALGTIFGGLGNYQKLYDAGHRDAFGQTIDQQAGATGQNVD